MQAFAQDNLSKEELDLFQKRAVEYVFNFEYYLQQIAQSEKTEDKNWDIKAALDLFEEKTSIEVSNVNGKKRHYPVKDYLSNVVAKYRDKYDIVVIDFEATKIENLKEMRDDQGKIYYVGSYKFIQHFYAEKKSSPSSGLENRKFVYGDVTSKKGKIFLKLVPTIGIGEEWILKLGDVEVDDTHPIKDTN